jgi:tRNA pseudouridine38-40 synthase
MRFALGLEYKGTNYHGWQAQDGGLATIQAHLEAALSKVADHQVNVVCAGRTDAGVHALGQVVHFESDAKRVDRAWVFGVNDNLPLDIRVLWVREVPTEFHARFTALARHYRYVIYNDSISSAVYRDLTTFYPRPLNVALMQEAANYLIGEHDFTSYRGADCQAHSPIRRVIYINLKAHKSIITLDIAANAFLLHMVRNIVGVLLPIGSGQYPPTWAREVLAARDRRVAGVTAPASGLYFLKSDYPLVFALPAKSNDFMFSWEYNNC